MKVKLVVFGVAYLMMGLAYGNEAPESTGEQQSSQFIFEEKKLTFANPGGLGSLQVPVAELCHHKQTNTIWTLNEVTYCNVRARKSDGRPSLGECSEYLSERLTTPVEYEKKVCARTAGQGKDKTCAGYRTIKSKIPLENQRKVYAKKTQPTTKESMGYPLRVDRVALQQCPEAIVED